MPGLSSLGLGSEGNQSSNSSGGLSDVLGSGITDELGKSRMLSTQLTAAKGSEPRSPLDVLTSPRGLMALIASIGAIAAGGDARSVGVGALMGTLQQAQAIQEGERTQKEAAIEQLSDQFEKSQTRLDKLRNQVQTIFNTNPDSFVDPGTGEPMNADQLGALMTGEPIAIHADSRRVLAQRGKDHDQMTSMWMDVIEKATDPGRSKFAVEQLLRHLTPDGLDPNPEMVRNVSETFRTAAGSEDDIFALYLKEFGMSGRNAAMFAFQNQLSLKDPEVLRMLVSPTGDAKKIMDDATVALIDRVIDWENAPENREEVLRIRGQFKTTREMQEAINQAFFREHSGDEGLSITQSNQMNKVLGVGSLTDDEILWIRDYTSARNQAGTARLISDVTNEALGMTPEELRDTDIKAANERKVDRDRAGRLNAGNWYSAELNQIELGLREGAKRAGVNPSDDEFNREVDAISAHVFSSMGIERTAVGELTPAQKKEMATKFKAEVTKTLEAWSK